MDYDDGVYNPVTMETIRNWHRKKTAFDDTLAQREEKARQSRERVRKLVKKMMHQFADEESDCELGGPHVLETMRGMLGEI